MRASLFSVCLCFPHWTMPCFVTRICSEMAELSTNAREYEKAINFYKEGLTYDETYVPVSVNRDFKQPGRQRHGTSLKKWIHVHYMLLRDYSNTFNLSNVAELSRSWICRDGVQVQIEKRKFTVVFTFSIMPWIWSFDVFFFRGRQRNVPKCKTHAQSNCDL